MEKRRGNGLATQKFTVTFNKETTDWIAATAPRMSLNKSAFVERAVLEFKNDIEQMESLGLSIERVHYVFAGIDMLKNAGHKAMAKSKAFAQFTM